MSELTSELAISRRTLFRDLKMLQLAGIPYYHEPDLGYRVARSFFLPPISLTVPETLGLMLLGKAASAQRSSRSTPPASRRSTSSPPRSQSRFAPPAPT